MSATIRRERVAIGRDERRARQDRLRAEAERRGWPGVAVLGRGGGTYDRHGDLHWLTGHYPAFPYLRDRPPLWSGRAHGLAVVPVDGPVRLLCSTPELDPDELAVDDVQVARGDFAEQAAALLRPLAGGGFAGADATPLPLAAGLGLDHLHPADGLLETLRRRKSPAEAAVLREACAVGSRAVEALIEAAVPGATEGEAVAAAAAEVYRGGGDLYLVALAAGDRAAHFTGRPLPGWRPERPLRRGELARLDLVLVYEGYFCDFGRSWPVGGDGDTEVAALVATLRTALEAACAAARPGAPAGAVARAGRAALPAGVSTAYPPHWGHGLGVGWEGPWLLPDNDEPLAEGYALAVEVALQGPGGTVAGEENLLVGPDGPELLSTASWPGTG